MFRWKVLGASWRTSQACQVLEVLKENGIPAQMFSNDIYFFSPFHLPRTDLRWQISIRWRDRRRAMSLLASEGLLNGATCSDRADPDDRDATTASPAADPRRIPHGTTRSGCRCSKLPVRRAPV